ncbi:MAG: hypothetical protein ACE5DN_03955, partial [Flavobacteriales bacterium]
MFAQCALPDAICFAKYSSEFALHGQIEATVDKWLNLLIVQKKRICVIGGGSWGTALMKMLCNTQEQTGWWMRRAEEMEYLGKFRHNRNYLSSV